MEASSASRHQSPVAACGSRPATHPGNGHLAGVPEDRRVVIIDDELSSKAHLRSLLKSRGWMIAEVSPEHLRDVDYRPDAALIDICPNGTAVHLDLLQVLRGRNPSVRIAALTSYASMAIASQALRAGADCCLLKPVLAAELQHFLDGAELTHGGASGPHDLPSLGAMEWEYINRVLAFHQGNISAASRTLGIRRSTLQRRLKKLPPSR